MKILFLTNFYPPASRGGYEQWCQEIAEALNKRGHEVIVLTSDYGQAVMQRPEPTWVRRVLHLEMEMASLRNGYQFFSSRKARENRNIYQLRQLVKSFIPDIVLVWGMWNLSHSLPALAEELLPGRVVYYLGDYWPILPNQYQVYWQAPARNWATGILKFLLRPLAQSILSSEDRPTLSFEHAIFPTNFVRDELIQKGFAPQNINIIYGAINTSQYQYRNGSSGAHHEDDLLLLFVGRLTPDKGVHTAIKAFGYLVNTLGYNNLRLSIIGQGEPDYEAHLHLLARQENVEPLVTFQGSQSREAMPRIYQQADIFLFTSEWPEPFGRVLVEAMASGAAVVGSATGGATEILVDNTNALLYVPGDVISLATQTARLIESPTLRQRLAVAGRQTAVTKFDIHRMTTEIEMYLERVAHKG